jgi:hypothetical protein
LCHEKISADKGDQPDNRKKSEAHLQDLQGSGFVYRHSASKKHEAAVGHEVYHRHLRCAQGLVVEGIDSGTSLLKFATTNETNLSLDSS